MKVILTGGGTGGHLYPALSIARALCHPQSSELTEHSDEILAYIGSEQGIEARVVPGEGLPFYAVPSRKVTKLLSVGTLGAGAALLRGAARSLALLNKLKPDVVVGTGGYVAAGVVLAQCLRGGKSVIHEQNVVPGRTNLRLARFVTKIGLSFEGARAYFPASKCVLTGLPIRGALFANPLSPAEARLKLGLAADPFTLLVLGGSQGARVINDVIAASAPALTAAGVQIVHQTGARDYERLAGNAGTSYRLFAYLNEEELAAAYAGADLVLCRAGASTLAEITAAGLPSVLVPYAAAYADHQTANARYAEKGGAARLLPEGDLTADAVISLVRSLRDDAVQRKTLAEGSRALGMPYAAQSMVQLLRSVLEER